MSAHVIFYEKPGCKTNAKQKQQLIDHGCTLNVRDILHHTMQPHELLEFLAPYPVVQWFNKNAPAIKNKDIDIHTIDAVSAIRAIEKEPILLRRPLLIVEGEKMVGFDQVRIGKLLGISFEQPVRETCSNTAPNVCANS